MSEQSDLYTRLVSAIHTALSPICGDALCAHVADEVYAEIVADLSEYDDEIAQWKRAYFRAANSEVRNRAWATDFRSQRDDLTRVLFSVLQIHQQHDDSRHCAVDGSPYPCPTVQTVMEASIHD
jgi:hypothetical protein